MRKETAVLQSQISTQRRAFKVGDSVTFYFVSKEIQGRIIEDRGAIGSGGRHLYRVRVDGDDAREIELPAEELSKT